MLSIIQTKQFDINDNWDQFKQKTDLFVVPLSELFRRKNT